jgi:hypothetical protein
MKQYLLSVHSTTDEDYNTADHGYASEEEMQQAFKDVEAFNERLQKEGAWVFAGGLEAPTTATVVRSEGGEVITTDGPFAEAKEQIGGFWVVNAPDLDAAVALAGDASAACKGPVEVRPFQDEPED